MTANGKMLPEEEKEIEAMLKDIDSMELPPLPEYLHAEHLAPAIARGLSHAEHKAEWEAKHGPIRSANADGDSSAAAD